MEDAYKESVYNEIFKVIKERYEETDRESKEDKGNKFKDGRALAYWEMNEIVMVRLEMLEDDYLDDKQAEEKKKWGCPYYHKMVDSDECCDMYYIANRFFKDESLVKEEDRDKLAEMCEKCKKYAR